MRRTLAVAFLSLALAAPAESQTQNKSLKLNTPILANQYLMVGDQTGLDGVEATGYTIEAWVYPASYSGYPTIVGNDYENGFWLGLDIAAGVLRFWPLGFDQGTVLLGATPIPLNQWTHVAASYSPGTHTARLFINGQQDASSSGFAGTPNASAAPLCIGADRPGNGGPAFFWRGWIDEVRIWNRAIGSIQLGEQRFHRAGTPRLQYAGDYDGLAAYWDMEDPIAGVFQDRWAGNGEAANNASPVNGSVISATVIPPIAYNHGLYLGGVGDFVYRDLPPGFSFEDGLTIEAWVAPQGLLAPGLEGVLLPHRAIVGRYYQQSFYLGLTPDNRLRFYPSGGIGEYFEGVTVIPLDEWTHVAAVYRPGLAQLYVNGVFDAASTDFVLPPVENQVPPLIGADPPPVAGPREPTGDMPESALGIAQQFLYWGWMDEVRLTGAALGAATIREGMFRSTPPSEWVADELGVPHLRLTASLDPSGEETVYATGAARFERSGAPLFGPDAELASASVHGFRNRIPGQVGVLPGGANYGFIQLDLFMAQNFTINDVNAFVSLSSTSINTGSAARSLEQVQVELQHPGLTITLMDYGNGRGRDLQTVFDDEAALTFATATSPYVDGVRSSEALANLDGFPSSGTWHLNVTCGKGVEACVWAWGISFNDINPLGVDPASREPGVSFAASNPVREQGALRFSLAAEDRVTLRLLDVTGRQVRTLLDGPFGAGEHRVSWNARDLAAGIYFLRLELGNGQARQSRVAVIR